VTPETLVALRTLAGLTQSGLSALLGVHRTTVARWETGKIPIPHWVERTIGAAIM
jgi:transcriptional regulator with XRE-family HTH domain